ncbi:MAG: glycosyltransferase [Candidatus Shapirobacteria bacterium]|nr:glycosyltransferase [Candidatus Shapirobacteria bacterium]MDD5074055.1 glycosyltransferase [Candidatus Shapirobacteria bacterium]MDD5481691.1 glycosyltransferase [Candidatus Shapirobacteria bacterium]
MKVALVYDWLDSWGGAERVLLEFNRLFPQAPIYTSLYQPKRADFAKKFPKIEVSFLQKLSSFGHRFLAPLMPLAFENFDFTDFDLVISVSSFAAKGVITKPPTKHVCYLLTPTRFLWFPNQYQGKKFPKIVNNYLKTWDKIASQRPDKIITISGTVQKRCQEIYQRPSRVIYPPVNNKFSPPVKRGRKANFFLIVSRLERQKRVDLAIRAFNDLGWPLIIIGIGSQEKRLKRLAKKNIRFLGKVSDQKLIGYYQKAQAVIFPQEEDFGLVALEALACQTPVIAFRAGGAVEIVKEGQTGLFFTPQNSQSLKEALLKFPKNDYNKDNFYFDRKRFNQKTFTSSWKELISDYVNG